MGEPPRILVILPTYNECENIAEIVPAILRQNNNIDVLIVDDASPDGTGEVADRMAAENPRIHVLHREAKLGLGTAYVSGFRWGLARGFDRLFEMDADLSHDPRHIPEFLEAAERHDLVLGSRYLRGVTVVNWPITRLLLSYFANRYARITTGLPMSDLTSGFKCFRRAVLEAIDLDAVRSNGYSFQIEMTFRAWHLGFRVGEIPIVFVDRSQGQSKMSRRIIWEAVWMVWRLRLWKLLGKI